MTRTTIDFGIDLGTTNSAIALFTGNHGELTKVIKNTRDGSDADITPSAVYINKNGTSRLGRRAKDRIRDEYDDVQIEFKRSMGTDTVLSFKSSGQQRTPEELSAEILQSLRGDVQQRTGELLEAAVITVPAAFEFHQCEATKNAARLAGLRESPLLLEPTAAALAYGFQVDQEKAYWLVFDFGGGTFDATIIKSEEGTIQIVDHGGDNFLGGSNIDWAIVEKLLAPRVAKQYQLPDFVRGNKRWVHAFQKLKYCAEIAKIDLSRDERTRLEECAFEGDSGDEIVFECELTRSEVIGLAEPIIMRSVDIAKEVLTRRNLDKDAIRKVILVGGPTLAPYFREILTSALGISLDHSVDPLTVVARGAAVFAGTQPLNLGAKAPIPVGEYKMDVAKSFKPVGLESNPMVGGKVSGAELADFSGFTLELVNIKTQWRSGLISLTADGVFVTNLHAESGERNTYSVELYDQRKRKQKIKPDTITYTIGIGGDVEQPLINSLGIALANNDYHRIFEKGRGLPLTATLDYVTTHLVRHGRAEDVLRIPLVEGEDEKADRNRLNAAIEIHGDKIRRDLPAGSDVEVTLKLDESRILSVKAYVHVLDEEFPAKIDMIRRQPNAKELEKDFEAEMCRFRAVKASAAGCEIDSSIDGVDRSLLAMQVKETLAAARADPAAALECEKRLLDLKRKFDDAADALEWPSLVREARSWLGYLEKVVEQHGDNQQKEKAQELASDVAAILSERQAARLRKKIEQITVLYYEIVTAQPGWWVNQFQILEKQQDEMSDPAKANRLFGQARDCLAKNNAVGLQSIVKQLWDLLPEKTVQEAKRGFGSTIVRR